MRFDGKDLKETHAAVKRFWEDDDDCFGERNYPMDEIEAIFRACMEMSLKGKEGSKLDLIE